MKAVIIFFIACFSLKNYCQVVQINTGTIENLIDLSVFKKNIMIGGWTGYVVKSNDECNTLSPLSTPNAANYATRLKRLDSNNVLLLSYTPSQTLLFKSSDGGLNWIQKSNTTGSFSHDFGFFDSLVGIMTSGITFHKTIDGGINWTQGVSPFQIGTNLLKTFGDSLVCMGGENVTGGGLVLSKNRGNTWGYGWGSFGSIQMTDCFFLNKDTIFGVTKGGAFTKTTNGGANWDSSSEPPIFNSYGVYFKRANEGYVVGMNDQNKGIIVKTTDLGQTWSTFNTGITTALLSIAFLNDSMALLTGTGGTLLKWNYKKSVFTGIVNNYLSDVLLKVFPNPIRDKLRFEFTDSSPADFYLSFDNSLGQVVYSKDHVDLREELDLNFLLPGIYYLKVGDGKVHKTFKIVKE